MKYWMSKNWRCGSREKGALPASTAKQQHGKEKSPNAIIHCFILTMLFPLMACYYRNLSPSTKKLHRMELWSILFVALLLKTMHACIKRHQDYHMGPENIAPMFRYQNYLPNIRCSILLRVDFSADSAPPPPAFNHWVGRRRRDFILPRISTGAHFLQILNLFCLLLEKIKV